MQDKEIKEQLERTNKLLQKLVAIQLHSAGATQREIAENLDIALGHVNKLIKGVKKI